MGDKPTPVIAGLLPHVYNEREAWLKPSEQRGDA
jgi:hypothetical protein